MPREPGPIQPEAGPVPSHNGLRLDENQCLSPPVPEPRNMTQKTLSVTARRGWECLRFKTPSCCRRAKFSKRRSRREEKNRITGTSSSFTRRSMREVVHGETQIGYWANRHDSTADRYFGEQHVSGLRASLCDARDSLIDEIGEGNENDQSNHRVTLLCVLHLH